MKSLLRLSSLLAIIAGTILVLGGFWGISFTYENVTREHIVTPEDATIPGKPVSDPFTLKSQADIIRHHTLNSTEGKTYAEMPRQIEKVDEAGNPVLDADGNAVMVPNDARNLWITATTLTTALNLGILTYAFSAFIVLIGGISIWTGVVFWALAKNYKK